MIQRHGGDIYRNQVNMDFSVNTNPLGIPQSVRDAMQGAITHVGEYPDPENALLTEALASHLLIPKERLCFGNGASELFMAIMHALKPKKILLPVPSFYGYEHAAEAAGCEIVAFLLREENDFALQEDFYSFLTEETDLIFLANPNNPTGQKIDKAYGMKLLKRCLDKNITVVMDECFIEFVGEEHSFMEQLETFDNLIIVRAFTKIYAIPGVRLGYLLCANQQMRKQICAQLPEWNLSTFAQAAGVAAIRETAYVKESVDYAKNERLFLENKLRELGIRVFPGDANYILIYTKIPLFERLLEKKILIRDCANFAGLSKGYYRIAVRTREENEKLWKAIGECIESN